jgi:hypothetical protein
MFERPAKALQAAKKHGYRRDTDNQQKGSTRHDRPLRPTAVFPVAANSPVDNIEHKDWLRKP